MTDAARKALVAEIREEFARHFDGESPAAACLYWSFYGCRVFARHGIRALVQAGSASWPTGAVDDGVSPTHFAYQWEATSAQTQERLAAGVMPEMHVWIALPEACEIVDLTMCFLREQAKRCGVGWGEVSPPDFIWEAARGLRQRDALYYPEPQATLWALARLGLVPVSQVVLSTRSRP